MSFLSFAFLFALPLASAPMLLHLFDRQRNVVIEWGAMQFLVAAARRGRSSHRLQQWVLLIFRTLAIFCLVIALARPLVNSTWLAVTDRRDTILVVDNSLSMTRIDDGILIFQAAIETAVEHLDRLPPGDTVRILLTSPYPIWMTGTSVRIGDSDQSSIREKLFRLKPTQGSSDLLDALLAASQAEVLPGVKHRRVVMLTDGQAADWSLRDTSKKQRLHNILQKPVVPTEVNLVALGTKHVEANNLAVNIIHCNRTQVGAGQSFALVAEVQNHGRTASAPCSLRWTAAEDEQYRCQIPAIGPGAIYEALWKHSFLAPGIYPIKAEITTDDVLVQDNHETLIMEVVDCIPVLVVESAPTAAEMLQDAYFVQAAMGWMDGAPLATQGVYVPTLVRPDELERTDLHEYRAVIIPNLTELSADTLHKLQRFVFEGGGLWVALGPRTDVERFNQFFFADTDGLAPLAIDRVVNEPDTTGPQTTIDPFVATHPATASLTDSSRLDLGKIVVSSRFRFASPRLGTNRSVLLSLTNGDPFAVEKFVGLGRVIVQAAPLRIQWSELARSQAFVVIVQEWLNYLTQPRSTRHNLAPGDAITLHVAGADVLEATLRTPQGDEFEMTSDAASGGVVFHTSRTTQPGDYSLEVGLTGDKLPFHVHRDPRESNLTPLTSDEREFISTLSGQGATNSNESSKGFSSSEPAWPLLLLLLLGLILAELLLSGSMAQRRFGANPISETSDRIGKTQFGLANPLIPTQRPMTDRHDVLETPLS